VLAPEGGSVLIGKDTRLSGYMFEAALEAGFVAAGVDVMLIGPLPTPGIAYMTRQFGCRFGVVISASHNPYHDNGIKFFDATGGKLSDEEEARIEAELESDPITRESQGLGRASRVDKSRKAYQDFCISTMPAGSSLAGMKIVIDCAHGAGYKVAPRILTDLGAEIVPLGCSPNGRNINQACGALAPDLLQLTVPGVRAQVGIALDGDGDRLVMVDHLGRKVDGDQLLYVIATHRHATGRLQGPVVGTLMTNFALERAFIERGIGFHRAQVGDRYVLAKLRETGGVLGGETSGHLLTLDYTTTGDAMVVALQVLSIMRETGRTLAELTADLSLLPQTMVNVKVARRFDPLQVPAVRAARDSIETRLAGRGRAVLRASGTEPLIRVMIEAEDGAESKALANELADAVRAAVPRTEELQ
jgi:phosphoglucosamine mutase